MASPVPSPSPTPPPAQSSSPAHHPQHHSTKPGALVSAAKSVLSEQSARLSLKHSTDLDLLDDLRLYLKTRCSIEQNYAQAMAKLNSAHSKRTSSLLTYCAAEDEISDVKTVYTSWKLYQEEMEKHAKGRLAVFEQLASACDQLKSVRSHKLHISKKCLDTHLKKMQEEIVNSVAEIDKTRKLYFEEEHLAKQARDKEEKIKKRKTGIFSSFANLQTKKERTSAHREASDIQSTQARNDYIMALAAGNAHLGHYYGQDLPNLMYSIDDAVLDKCRSFILNLLQTEREMVTSWHEVIHKTNELMEHSSADYTNAVFLKDPHSACINDTLAYEFQPCDNDAIDYISLEHNADIALRNEGQKWFTWFSKECRNLNRLSAQLVRLQALQSEGHKTVEVTGSGQVDIETRIDEIRQQLRKCEISKLKAKARLQVIRESGAEVEDFDSFENQVTQEIKQQSLDVDINLGSLSRTPSVRSNMGSSSEARSPVPIKPEADSGGSTGHVRPESSSSAEQLDSPDREVLQLGSSMECASPAPTSAAYASASAGWGMDYDPTQVVWDDAPAATTTATSAAYNGYDEPTANTTSSADYGAPVNESMVESAEMEQQYGYEAYEQTGASDGFSLVGKQCFALYAYAGQSEDELTVAEQEIISVIDASDKDWVRAQNEHGQYGYVPAAYLQEMSNQPSATATSQPSAVTSTSTESEPEKATPPEVPAVLPEPPVMITTSSVDDDAELPPPPPPAEQDQVEYVRAIYGYEATNSEEITFAAGALIKIVDNSSDDGWWTGEINGQVGHFPSMLVADLDDEEEETSDEEDEEDEETPHLPPIAALPPVAPPVIASPDAESTEPTGAPASVPRPPPFDPPPKPMTLMTPQMGVIIQPTPEIESKPMLGSEEANEPVPPAESDIVTDESCIIAEQPAAEANHVESKSNGEANEPDSIKASMAIAAAEVSETITQQAIDDSMRELSRRTSAASSVDGSAPEVATDGAAESFEPSSHPPVLQPNGDIASNSSSAHQSGDLEEDCK